MTVHRWDIPSIAEAKEATKRKKPKSYNQVKDLIDSLKVVMKKESDPDVRKHLATAGLSLNRILLR
jgi:hypothetical protein